MMKERRTITFYNGTGPAVLWRPPGPIRIVEFTLVAMAGHTTAGYDQSGAILTTVEDDTTISDMSGSENVLAQACNVSTAAAASLHQVITHRCSRIVRPGQAIRLTLVTPSAGSCAASAVVTYEIL
jgi:hypothetical protein